MNKVVLLHALAFCLVLSTVRAQKVTYPYPLHLHTLLLENKLVRMAYMDILPVAANGKTVILFHGKNFNGFYWKDVIPALSAKGYRVIVPDQVGWGRSDKPDLHYSFHMLAKNNKHLLDSLGIAKVSVLGHSMGGMLAARFCLMYPQAVEKLILENPIGLEDYRTFVPYQDLQVLATKERSATYESYKKYQQSYYPVWKPNYEAYVQAQAESLTDPNFDQIAWVNALTYQMIYEQPVVYELKNLHLPTLLVIGQEDRTVVGKDQLPAEKKASYGNYPVLGKKTKEIIPNSTLVELKGVGHIPHIQENQAVNKLVLDFL